MNTFFLRLSLLLSITSCLQAAESTIEPYQADRDRAAIISILDANPEYLTYEHLGCPAGTTLKYIESPKYKTAVLRIDDKTIGFVNYVVYDNTLLTFNFGKQGLIHLIGVDQEHQKQGYGTQLLKYAIQKCTEQNTSTIQLAVKTDNPAKNMYAKAGFTSVGQYSGQERLQLKINVPADKLPKGNLIQQYPKITFALLASAVGAYFYKKS